MTALASIQTYQNAILGLNTQAIHVMSFRVRSPTSHPSGIVPQCLLIPRYILHNVKASPWHVRMVHSTVPFFIGNDTFFKILIKFPEFLNRSGESTASSVQAQCHTNRRQPSTHATTEESDRVLRCVNANTARTKHEPL